MFDIDDWLILTIAYVILAFVTFLPVIAAKLRKIEVKKGENRFETYISSYEAGSKEALETIERLNRNFSRIEGALKYWKKRAEWNRLFHYYTLCWTLLVSITIPVLLTLIDIESYSKIFMIVISLHSAIMLGFHRTLKIENNYKTFKHGKAEFCDMYRRMLDRPGWFGETDEERMETFFAEAEQIRKYLRCAEIDNIPEVKKDYGEEDINRK